MSCRIVLLVSWALGFACVALGQEPLRVETVRGAWKEREARVRTARFNWKQTVFAVKGAYDDGKEIVMERNGGKDPGTNPPEDHSYTSNCSLSIDGDRLAFEFSQRDWDSTLQKYADTRTDYKFDGKKQLSLHHRGFTDWPVALIRAMPRGAQLTWDTGPVLRNLRGINEKLRAEDLDEYASSGAVLALAGGRGQELLSKRTPTNSERHLWIDPEREYVVLRYTIGPPNRPTRQIDLKYKPDGTVGWVPAEWKIVEASMKDGRICFTTTATVTSYSINEPIDEATFAFSLPLGCRVVDETSTPHDYLIRDDGSTRVMESSDFGKTYQEIVSTPGPQLSVGSRRLAGPLLAAFVGLGVLLLAAKVWLFRRTSRRASTPSPPSGPMAGDVPA